jgi:hypothetical protein
MVTTSDERNGDRYALYLLDTRDPAQWELLEAYPTRAEADANAAGVAQDERVRATRVLAFAPGRPVPRFLDNTTGDRDARAIARGFALFDPDDHEPPEADVPGDAPGAGALRPPQKEQR